MPTRRMHINRQERQPPNGALGPRRLRQDSHLPSLQRGYRSDFLLRLIAVSGMELQVKPKGTPLAYVMYFHQNRGGGHAAAIRTGRVGEPAAA